MPQGATCSRRAGAGPSLVMAPAVVNGRRQIWGLSPHQAQLLERTEHALNRSAPDIAAMLAAFGAADDSWQYVLKSSIS